MSAFCSPRRDFAYSPLENGCFRLLWIEAEVQTRLVCESKQFPVHGAPEYVALSYVWGEGLQSSEIVLDECILHVSVHLRQAMETILSLFEQGVTPKQWLWVDAVCIDQDNLEEKAIQVPLMGDIYHRAQRVLIWFGEPSDGDEIGLNALEWLFWFNESKNGHGHDYTEDCVRECGELERLLARADVGKASLEALYESSLMIANVPEEIDQRSKEFASFRQSLGEHMLPLDHKLWLNLLTVLNDAWYWRIWTIQEISLAREASLLLEHCDLPWNFLDWYRKVLRNRKCVETLYSSEIAYQIGFDDIFRSTFDARQFSTLSPREMSTRFHKFQLLLLGLRGYRAKVPKDYIYGLLGIAGDEIRQQIVVDYTDSTTTGAVFAQAVMAACKLGNGAQFWIMLMDVYGGMSREIGSLPSWVPDFSSSSYCGSFCTFLPGPTISRIVRDQCEPFARISFDEGARVATVRGLVLDHVASAVTIVRAIDQRDMLEIIKNPQAVLGVGSQHFWNLFGPDQQSWFEEMDSVFSTAGHTTQLSPPWWRSFCIGEAAQASSIDYHALKTSVREISERHVESAPEACDILGMNDESIVELVSAMLLLLSNIRGRRFFVTAAERTGFAPYRVQKGDSVCLIAGGSSDLHILSGDLSRHVTAGVCVEGFMENDAISVIPENERDWQEFSLH